MIQRKQYTTADVCTSLLHEMIQEIIQIKSTFPEYPRLRDYPLFNAWVDRLDRLTDQLMWEGGL